MVNRVSVSRNNTAVPQPVFNEATANILYGSEHLFANPSLVYEQASLPEWDHGNSGSEGLITIPDSLELSWPAINQLPVVPESLRERQDISPFEVLPPAVSEPLLMKSGMWLNNTPVSSVAIVHRSNSVKQALRPLQSGRAFLLTTMLLGQLSAYPRMMIHGNHLPPFIYPGCSLNEDHAPVCGGNGGHQCLPKPLAISAGLVQMFYSRTAGNTEFIWKTIYAEQSRLHYEVGGYRQKLLSG